MNGWSQTCHFGFAIVDRIGRSAALGVLRQP